MAYLKPASECDCIMCPGYERPENPEMIGGWICLCSCHRKKSTEQKLADELSKTWEDDENF